MPFERPTTTPVPDELFDVWLTVLSEVELKVLLYIIRRTLGFRKSADTISYRQFLCGITTQDGRVIDRGCVRNRTALSRALKHLEALRLVRTVKRVSIAHDPDVTRYSLWFEDDAQPFPDDDPRGAGVVSTPYQGSTPAVPPVVANAHHGGIQRLPTTNSPQHTVSNRVDPSNGTHPVHAHASTTPYLDALLIDLSREFHDQSHTPSNLAHGRHLLAQSGLDERSFVQRCYAARATTRARGNIAKDARDGSPSGTKNRMPYFWTVLAERLPST